MHRIEKVFALRVDAHAELLTCTPQALFQLCCAFTRARRVADNHHGELALNNRLVDVDDTATRFGEDLRNTRDNARVVHAEDRDDDAFGRTCR